MTQAEYSHFREQLRVRKQRLSAAVDSFTEAEPFKNLLDEVDHALERMDAGTYGVCEECHEYIEPDRLLSDPVVRICLDHLTASAQRELEHDLELAASIQAALLPKPSLRTDGWETYYYYQAAGTVSGDYCDLIPCSDGLLFALGDVAGKGVAASMLVMQLHALFHSLGTQKSPIEELVVQINHLLCQSSLAEHYATLVCGCARPTGELEIVNAGHLPVLIMSGGKITQLESTGLPVGLFCSSEYSNQRLRLERGDTLVIVTDGLLEAWNGSEEFGLDRSLASLLRSGDDSLQSLIQACLDDLDVFLAGRKRADDLSILAIRRES
jgi:sigma-B regulation protein RsbU (phosphoserine phosphatase)